MLPRMMMRWWWDGDDDKVGGDLNDSDFDNENILKSCDDDPTFSAKLALNAHQGDDQESRMVGILIEEVIMMMMKIF